MWIALPARELPERDPLRVVLVDDTARAAAMT